MRYVNQTSIKQSKHVARNIHHWCGYTGSYHGV
jgi:hypothetical protein